MSTRTHPPSPFDAQPDNCPRDDCDGQLQASLEPGSMRLACDECGATKAAHGRPA